MGKGGSQGGPGEGRTRWERQCSDQLLRISLTLLTNTMLQQFPLPTTLCLPCRIRLPP